MGIVFSPETTPTFPPPGFSLKWVNKFIQEEVFINAFRVSLILAAVVVSISVVTGLLTSYGMVRYNFRGKDFLNMLFFMPLIVPAVVTGSALLFLLRGILGIYISFFNLTIAHVILTIPFSIRAIAATLSGFDITLEESAKVLGSSGLRAFRRITLPMIKPGIIAASVFAFVISLDEVTASVFLSRSDALILPVVLLTFMREQVDPTFAAASIFLILIYTILIFIISKTIGLSVFIGLLEKRTR
ncbi:ABC transporter permease [Candidatus Hecatella orcuttiae]|uniref:ABC transporter permease n=1 Tax=Candidatus Hecatella orcuttiae TaxID=1935119 RepID=UPI002867B08C|nr:ABC transporter permease subunit [Candidatus Hecatella orcuttiae]